MDGPSTLSQWGDFDSRVFEAEVGERFVAFEVGQIGGRCAVAVEDVEDVVGGQGIVAELRGGFEDVHSALQSGEGRSTVGSEGEDFPVEDGFAVVEDSAERIDDLGERRADVVAVAGPEFGRGGTRCGNGSLAIPFALEGPVLPG